MRPLRDFPFEARVAIRYVLCDIDDTLTTGGRLPAAAYGAMEALRKADIRVVPVTGRPAGWCDHIARMWPVDGVVGENGAHYYRYNESTRKMERRYWKSEVAFLADQERLDALRDTILAEVDGAAVSADQAFRVADLAIDFREDVPPLPRSAIDRIIELCEEAGATPKESTIHVNAWFGDFDKLAMTRFLFAEVFGEELDVIREEVVFVGDSPNDVPMFRFFPNAVGVANVADFGDRVEPRPAWITEARGGAGFAELAEALLAAHRGP